MFGVWKVLPFGVQNQAKRSFGFKQRALSDINRALLYFKVIDAVSKSANSKAWEKTLVLVQYTHWSMPTADDKSVNPTLWGTQYFEDSRMPSHRTGGMTRRSIDLWCATRIEWGGSTLV